VPAAQIMACASSRRNQSAAFKMFRRSHERQFTDGTSPAGERAASGSLRTSLRYKWSNRWLFSDPAGLVYGPRGISSIQTDTDFPGCEDL